MTGPLPRVAATGLDGTRSVAVELCPFRLCDWSSPDTRTAERAELDGLLRAHLLTDHRRELVLLGQLAADSRLVP